MVILILTGKFNMLINSSLLLKINPAKDGIFDFPLFHHSIIPCMRQKHQASINPFNFPAIGIEFPRRLITDCLKELKVLIQLFQLEGQGFYFLPYFLNDFSRGLF